MLYNETVVKVFATPDQWLEWLTVYSKERHEYLSKRNCSGFFTKPVEVEAPAKYPVLALVGFAGGFSVDPKFIYQDQIMELLGIPNTFFIKACESVRGYSEVYLMRDRSAELPALEKPVETAPIFEDRTV